MKLRAILKPQLFLHTHALAWTVFCPDLKWRSIHYCVDLRSIGLPFDFFVFRLFRLHLPFYTVSQKSPHFDFLNNMMKNLPNSVIFGTQNPDIICSLENINFASLPKNCRCTTLWKLKNSFSLYVLQQANAPTHRAHQTVELLRRETPAWAALGFLT